MKVFGVTGGSGSGKSTVIEVWRNFGALILNCDDIYHELLHSEKRLIWELEDAFPGVVSHGELNRRRLGELVFADHSKLARLNEIAHKYVVGRVKTEVSAARRGGADVVVIEALYIIETDIASMCDAVVGVVAPLWKRVKRVMERDGLDEEHAWARLRAQMDDEYFIQNCDIIIENNGTVEQLREKARDVYLNYR